MARLSFICLLLVLAFGCPASGNGTTLAGLRGGEVLIEVGPQQATLDLELAPEYGWNEPVRLYRPDGRLEGLAKTSRSSKVRTHWDLKQPGIYRLQLKRSYGARVQVTSAKVMFRPLSLQTSLLSASKVRAWFNVPPGTSDFQVHLDNRIGTRGRDVQLEIFDPQGRSMDVLRKAGFKQNDVLSSLGMAGASNENQALSDFSPETMPSQLKVVSSAIIRAPKPGNWSVVISGSDVGFWLTGIPSAFAISADQLFDPTAAAGAVPAKLSLTGRTLKSPFIGAVGHMGAKGNKYEKLLRSFGVGADKIFYHQDQMEPTNDNASPDTTDASRMTFAHAERTAKRGLFTLAVLRAPAPWVKRLSGTDRLAEFAEWGAWTASEVATTHGRSPADFTLQVLNEPNFEMSRKDYVKLVKAVASKVRSQYGPDKVSLAAPGLGSAESQDVVDYSWVEAILKETDADAIDTITWNLYRIRHLEDTELYAEALRKTRDLIKTHGKGKDRRVIIGATNRMGGLAPLPLFSGHDAALWWASVLSQVCNEGIADGIYYFMSVDEGIRAKGLFTSKWKAKSQAHVHKLFADVLSGGELVQTASDHPMLESVFTKGGGMLHAVVLNKGDTPLKVTLSGISKIISCQQLHADGRMTPLAAKVPSALDVPAKSILKLELQ